MWVNALPAPKQFGNSSKDTCKHLKTQARTRTARNNDNKKQHLASHDSLILLFLNFLTPSLVVQPYLFCFLVRTGFGFLWHCSAPSAVSPCGPISRSSTRRFRPERNHDLDHCLELSCFLKATENSACNMCATSVNHYSLLSVQHVSRVCPFWPKWTCGPVVVIRLIVLSNTRWLTAPCLPMFPRIVFAVGAMSFRGDSGLLLSGRHDRHC